MGPTETKVTVRVRLGAIVFGNSKSKNRDYSLKTAYFFFDLN